MTTCFRCGGAIRQHPKTGLIWIHDNTDGAYAGRQLDHDASPLRQYLVPVRFWETQEPAEVDVKSIGDEEWGAYVFHLGYGHTAYVRPSDLFPTRELAIHEAQLRAEEKSEQDQAEFDALFEQIVKGEG